MASSKQRVGWCHVLPRMKGNDDTHQIPCRESSMSIVYVSAVMRVVRHTNEANNGMM